MTDRPEDPTAGKPTPEKTGRPVGEESGRPTAHLVIHLLAIAGRVGVDLTLDDMDEWARGVPWLVDLQRLGCRPAESLGGY